MNAIKAVLMSARNVQRHDHIENRGTVKWIIGPLAPGHMKLDHLTPEGLPAGNLMLVTTNHDVQFVVGADEELSVYRLNTDDEMPCHARNFRDIGCVYREGHDERIFPHRYA